MIHLFAEYEEPAAMVTAIAGVRAAGARVEAYTPYPVAAIETALGARSSRIARTILVVGVAAAAGAYALQWLLEAYLYPLDVGGRPPHMPLAFVPITFEMGVLFASIAAVAAVLVRGRLLRLWYPSCEVEGIESATGWRFWLEVVPARPDDLLALERILERTGAISIRRQEVA